MITLSALLSVLQTACSANVLLGRVNVKQFAIVYSTGHIWVGVRVNVGGWAKRNYYMSMRSCKVITHVQYARPESGCLHQRADWVWLRPEPKISARRLISGTGSKRLTRATGVEDVGKQTRSDPMETVRPGKSRSDSRRSVRERQRKYLSAMRRNKRATHEIYVVLKAMSRNKHATPATFSRNNFAETCELWGWSKCSTIFCVLLM